MGDITYKDPFTLDGKLTPTRGVTEKSVGEAKALLGKALRGDYVADATLRQRATKVEAYSSSDLAPALAYLASAQAIPQLDKVQYPVAPIVGTPRTVKDFNPVTLYSLYGDLSGPGIDKNGAVARVPEGANYPTVTVKGQESFYSKLGKRGLRFDFTWEAQVNDTAGFFEGLPNEIRDLTGDTEYAEVFDAINSAGATTALVGGTLPNGQIVAKNSAISPAAIWRAIFELSNREVNGRKIGRLSGYNVLVPVGTKDLIDYELNKTIVKVQDGNLELSGDSFYQGALNGITTIESPKVTGTAWKVLPKPGATRRPGLELLKLRGYETPEIRVRNDGGESSFDTDTRAFRYRYVVGAALWDEKYILKSSGQGASS